MQAGFLFDFNKCVGCRACEIACINEHEIRKIHYRRLVRVDSTEYGFSFMSLGCNHCLNPECIRVCASRCFSKRRDGIVVHDGTFCIGCKRCLGACPFGAPRFNLHTQKVSKCDFCLDRLKRTEEPACISACICGALKKIDLTKPLDSALEEVDGLAIINFTKPSLRIIKANKPHCFWRSMEGQFQ